MNVYLEALSLSPKKIEKRKESHPPPSQPTKTRKKILVIGEDEEEEVTGIDTPTISTPPKTTSDSSLLTVDEGDPDWLVRASSLASIARMSR